MRIGDDAATLCARIAAEFQVAGRRGEIVMAQAARATAALERRTEPALEDVRAVAPYAIMHRKREVAYGEGIAWTDKDAETLDKVLAGE